MTGEAGPGHCGGAEKGQAKASLSGQEKLQSAKSQAERKWTAPGRGSNTYKGQSRGTKGSFCLARAWSEVGSVEEGDLRLKKVGGTKGPEGH